MDIDHFYTKIDGEWVRFNMRVVNDKWEYIPEDEVPDFSTDYWVDISYGGNVSFQDRFYCPDLASAIEFYQEGWKDMQYVDENADGLGLSSSGLYCGGRLIHGLSLDGDAPGHEGENMRRLIDKIESYVDWDEEELKPKPERPPRPDAHKNDDERH